MTRRRLIVGALIAIAIPIVALAWWLLSPLIIDTKVSEDFPFAANAVITLDMTMDAVEKDMAAASKTDRRVTEYMPSSLPAVDSEGRTFASIQELKSAKFRDADRVHQGSGTATVYQDANGTRVLRLDEFEVTNGPELHVFLTPHEDPKKPRRRAR